jgi:hypothetical protein
VKQGRATVPASHPSNALGFYCFLVIGKELLTDYQPAIQGGGVDKVRAQRRDEVIFQRNFLGVALGELQSLLETEE